MDAVDGMAYGRGEDKNVLAAREIAAYDTLLQISAEHGGG